MESVAFIYCRISQDRTGAELGVARQEEDCRKLAAERGLSVARVFVDNDISAYSGKKRPGYSAMLAALRRGEASVVLFWHTDRLHRSPTELEEYIAICRECSVQNYAVKGGEVDLSTPEGILRAGLLGQVARYESAHKADRVRRAMEQKAMKGEWLGGPRPFGWHFVDGVPEPHPVEAAVVADVCNAVLQGQSLGAIVAALNASGVTTSVGKPWGYAQLRQMLVRPRNAGLADWKGEIVGPSTFPALVSEDVWRAVVSILTDPRRRRSQSNKARHLLAGIAQCHCGAPVRSASVSGRSGEKYTIYRCPEKGTGHVGKRVSLVDSVVDRHMVAYRIIAARHRKYENPSREAEQLETEAAALRERLNEMALLAADGRITTSQLVASTTRIRESLEENESRQELLAVSAYLPQESYQFSQPDMTTPEAMEWFSSSVDTRRDYVRQVCNVILLPHGKGSARVFDADTVQVILKTKWDARGPLAKEEIPGLVAAWREAGIAVAEGAGRWD
ncbi:Recombinase [Arthrobacter sp. ov407]|uniref:recombinase family protein n=1 Tax=Arthrobacter sp. ov407 TaxID=1761748 RepID=UPI000891E5C1|nr:recombinase family protein [Arthrobacter sp. ov407]SDL90189.1 Recombinase [Arthrobacter sp. ov407]